MHRMPLLPALFSVAALLTGCQPPAKTTAAHAPTEASTPPATAPGSVWEQARARGVAFRGLGTEPGWMVEVDAGDRPALRAQLDYGERSILVPKAQGISSTRGFGGRTADGIDVVLRIYDKACSDGMSDESYPATITLAVGDQTYSGCGRFLAAQ